MSREPKSPTLNKILKETNDPAFQINRLAKKIHDDADAHELWDDFRAEMKKRLSMHSEADQAALKRYYGTSYVAAEVSEMRIAYAKKRHYGEEAADVLISLLSLCVEMDIDIGKEVVRKMDINSKRPKKHGKETFLCPMPRT